MDTINDSIASVNRMNYIADAQRIMAENCFIVLNKYASVLSSVMSQFDCKNSFNVIQNQLNIYKKETDKVNLIMQQALSPYVNILNDSKWKFTMLSITKRLNIINQTNMNTAMLEANRNAVRAVQSAFSNAKFSSNQILWNNISSTFETFIDDFSGKYADGDLDYNENLKSDIKNSEEARQVFSTLSEVSDDSSSKLDNVVSMLNTVSHQQQSSIEKINDLTAKVERIEQKSQETDELIFQLSKAKKKNTICNCIQAFLLALLILLGEQVCGTIYQEMIEPNVKQYVIPYIASTLKNIASLPEKIKFVQEKKFIVKPYANVYFTHRRNSPIGRVMFETVVQIEEKYKKWRKIEVLDKGFSPVAEGWIQNWKLRSFEL